MLITTSQQDGRLQSGSEVLISSLIICPEPSNQYQFTSILLNLSGCNLVTGTPDVFSFTFTIPDFPLLIQALKSDHMFSFLFSFFFPLEIKPLHYKELFLMLFWKVLHSGCTINRKRNKSYIYVVLTLSVI